MVLYKSLEFKNVFGEKVKVVDIPVLGVEDRHYFFIQVRLQNLASSLYEQPQPKSCYSFRDYLKRKMKWSEFAEIYNLHEHKNNA